MGVMFSHRLVGIMMWDRGVERCVLLDIRCGTRQSRATFGRRSGPPEALWPIFLPLTPFLWSMKVSVTKIVD